MFDQTALKSALVDYKRDFPTKIWPVERYKWEAVQHFQKHWDIDTADFADMLTRALSKAQYLLASKNNYPGATITGLAAADSQEVRAIFLDLYKEDLEVYERMERFKKRVASLHKKHSKEGDQHYQTENTISIYLWLRYPDKYYIYKYGVQKMVSRVLRSSLQFKKGAYANNVRNTLKLYDEIRKELQQDHELAALLRSQLDESCYPDPQLTTLTQDVGYYLSKTTIRPWLPPDYSPGISEGEWLALLGDEAIFKPSSLEIMKRMLDYGGEASCTQLALKYGNSVNFYNSGSSTLAQRVAEKTGCPVIQDSDDNKRWWPVLYQGRYAAGKEDGSFIWRLRKELRAALEKTDLSSVPLYADVAPALWKISHGTEATGIPDALKQIFEQRQVVVVNGNTAAKGQTKTSQGEDFVHTMKRGDFFYLCYGSSVKLLGEIVSDQAVPNAEMQDAWMERSYRLIALAEESSPYTGTKKWWTPNENSTCIRIDESDHELFESLILKPCFNLSLDALGRGGQMEMPAVAPPEKYGRGDFLKDVYMSADRFDALVAVLRNKLNIILQGAPGVGKTYAATRLAYAMMGEKDDSRIAFVQFHQSYSYEDFVMGYKPVDQGFQLQTGLFHRFCERAALQPDKEFFFIIDEINRGNLSKIFGELLMLIERSYRGHQIQLAYGRQEPFSVPPNLYIIGMMNTADRSLAMIDYALRRRFSFFDMEPGFDQDGFKAYQAQLNHAGLDRVINRIKEINETITKDPSLGKGFCIGHSFFCGQTHCTDAWLQGVIEFDILPMLREYWFEDQEKVNNLTQDLLGKPQ